MKKVRRPIEEMLAGANQGNSNLGIRCPECHCVPFARGGKTVINTVPTEDGTVRRRRWCRNCGNEWWTVEK